MHAIVSIHDVMPTTLDGVCALAELIPNRYRPKVPLLVVPGMEWTTRDIDQLKQLSDSGFTLAGHGWQHLTPTIRGVYHRLHSLLISRQAAEHLSFSRTDLFAILEDNSQWFALHQLPTPNFYIPPAWALGALTRDDLKILPFRYYEDILGIFDSETGEYRRLPLMGFEADTVFRQHFLSFWNLFNEKISSSARPVRVALHPQDLNYRLAHQLHLLADKIESCHAVSEIFKHA